MFSITTTRRLIAATTAVATLAAMLPLAASAASRPGEVWKRQQNQQARLQEGVKNGQLTRGEYNRDEARIQSINAQRAADLKANGGHLTTAERQQLNGELTKSSRDIYFTKHNGATQPGTDPRGTKTLPKLPPRGTPGYVADRVQEQMDRIHNGVANGTLTRGEYQSDIAKLDAVNSQREVWMKAQGGMLTSAQQAQLNAELDKTSNDIYYTRHNTNDQPGY